MTFAIAPVGAAVQNTPGDFIQWQSEGVDLGNARVDVIDFVGTNILATRGVGENSHVITVRLLEPPLPTPVELDYHWALLNSGDPGYPSPVSLHPTQHTVGPFLFDARLLISSNSASNSAFDDRLMVDGVAIRPGDVSTTPMPPGTELVNFLPAGDTVTLTVQNRFDPRSSGDVYITVMPIVILPATVEPDFGDVVCLLHMDVAPFVDSGPLGIAITNNNSVACVAGAAEYGAGGARFNGTSGQGLELVNAALTLGSAYVIEWSMNTSSTSGVVWRLGDESTNRAELYLTTPSAGLERPKLVLDIFNAGTVASWDGVPGRMTKYRLVRRSSTQLELFADGVSIGARTITSAFAQGNHGNGGKLYIGARTGGAAPTADMDEFRISSTAFETEDYTTRYDPFPDA